MHKWAANLQDRYNHSFHYGNLFEYVNAEEVMSNKHPSLEAAPKRK